MELFKGAKAVRLRSYHDKYLVADDDEESVRQDRAAGADRAARWAVEFVDDAAHVLRLRSCYGRYLMASGEPFLLGATGKKVLQTLPARLDSSVEWEPVRDGFQVRLKTRYGHFLRANGFLPPWRNSVTHDIPRQTVTQDWVLWDVDIVDLLLTPPPLPLSSSSAAAASGDSSPSSSAAGSPRVSKKPSFSGGSLPGSARSMEGRMIYYTVADGEEERRVSFKGTSVAELTERMEEETGTKGVVVCLENQIDGKLHPLRLQLPPNTATMRVVVVPPESRAARRIHKMIG